MIDQSNTIPESKKICPMCKTDGEVVRTIQYGSNNSEVQFKLECTECFHTWLYHSDD